MISEITSWRQQKRKKEGGGGDVFLWIINGTLFVISKKKSNKRIEALRTFHFTIKMTS